jgi:hypothetical protein
LFGITFDGFGINTKCASKTLPLVILTAAEVKSKSKAIPVTGREGP